MKSEMKNPENQVREYHTDQVVSFRSTRTEFGGLSNMAAGFSIKVNDVIIRTSEALYQACKFPLFPEVQAEILSQASPMSAKMVSRKYDHLCRQDWDKIRFKVMRWCLLVKLAQNWSSFGEVLGKTGDKPIVEFSRTDKVWAATPAGPNMLRGINALGRLLMDIRDEYVHQNDWPECVEPPAIPGFLLYNHPIEIVCSHEFETRIMEAVLCQ
jgi:ribA/ribD-fused uncharacterized protein